MTRHAGPAGLLAVTLALVLAPAAAAVPSSAGAGRAVAPLVLPGDARGSAAGVSGSRWLVGGHPGVATHRIARRFGARPLLREGGAYSVAAGRARRFAGALRAAGLLAYAEPNARRARAAFASDPLTPRQDWLREVVDPALTPPPVTPASPLLAVMDTQVDLSHPEFEGGQVGSSSSGPALREHGTAVTAVAAAPANGRGIVGVWPGMRATVFPSDSDTCEDAVAALGRAVAAQAVVINMSYGFRQGECFSHLIATQLAFGRGATLVASGGNEFASGNAPLRPATDPHILTVAAVTKERQSAFFSSENAAVDLSAPGVGVLTAVPPPFDGDSEKDGYQALSGTSFAAPMVAAAAAWVGAARPGLQNDQVMEALRRGSQDLGSPGWDQRFGHGLLSVGGGLGAPVPAHDPREPNDDIEWVDGRRFDDPDPPFFGRRSRRRAVTARLDRLEDPVDVWPVVFPPRSTLRMRITAQSGDTDLEVYAAPAQTVYARNGLLGRSARSGRARDTVTLTNRGRRQVSGWVVAYVDRGASRLDARYGLEVRRLRFRR